MTEKRPYQAHKLTPKAFARHGGQAEQAGYPARDYVFDD